MDSVLPVKLMNRLIMNNMNNIKDTDNRSLLLPIRGNK